MSCVAIIPARGGSKRIPRKNIRLFDGSPIITYSIKAAIDSGCFDEVMVSTEDEEIAEISRNAGASVPFKRSAKNADDYATTADVLIEVLHNYRRAGRDFSLGCCIYPFAVLVTPARLREGLKMLQSNPCLNGVVPILRFGYPVQRALRIVDHKLEMIDVRHINARSQDLEPTFHDAGQYYWFRVDALFQAKTLLGPQVAPIQIGEMEAQDIDSEDDWRLAELKYHLKLTRDEESGS